MPFVVDAADERFLPGASLKISNHASGHFSAAGAGAGAAVRAAAGALAGSVSAMNFRSVLPLFP